jgi:uncharacterized membrane protein
MDEQRLADALGCFSIALGLVEIAAPRRFAKALGLDDDQGVLQLLGLRELASGVGILSSRPRSGWLWARVAGDVMDLALLSRARTSRKADQGAVRLAIAAVTGLTVLDLLCSVRLEAKEEETDRAKTAFLQRSTTIGKPADELHRLWRDPQTLPKIMGDIAEVSWTGEDRIRWVLHGPLGRRWVWETRLVEDRPGQLLRWQSVEGAIVPNEGSVQFRPAPRDWGTEVRLRLRFDPPGGALGNAAAGLLTYVSRIQLGRVLRRFKSLAETGEIPTTERQPAARADTD